MSAPDLARRVVVTGLGVVGPWGEGVDALWQGLLSGRPAMHEVSRFPLAGHRTRVAAEVPPPHGAASPAVGASPSRRVSLADRFALSATAEALGQAGLAGHALPEAGVFFGSSTGGMLESEWYYARLAAGAAGRPWLGWVVSQQYNGPGDAVARALGVEGPVETFSSACTSAALAVGAALDAIRAGEVDVALAGGSDSLCQLTFAGFNALRAVDPEPCRPFRADRAGMNIGEGAAVLLLETLERARARGATPLAELLAGVSACDAHHMTAPSPTGSGAAAAIRRALQEAGIGPDEVDFVDAHGTGTPLNDAAEWQALAEVFGDRARSLPVVAQKGSHGHLLGAAGTIEAVGAVLCLRRRLLPPTPGDPTVDPQAPVDLVLGAPRPVPEARVAISINLAFGGSNAALLFRRWEEDGR